MDHGPEAAAQGSKGKGPAGVSHWRCPPGLLHARAHTPRALITASSAHNSRPAARSFALITPVGLMCTLTRRLAAQPLPPKRR